MRVAIIINPVSGKGGRRSSNGALRQSFVRAWLTRHDVDAEVVVTNGPGHATALVRSFLSRGFDRYVAWGGDGTANEVGAPLIGTGFPLGLVGGGSGDGLARGLGLPRDVDQALSIAIRGSLRRVDVGWLGPRHFFNVAGIGFDAAVAGAFNSGTARGLAGYVGAGLHGIWKYECRHYVLTSEAATFEGERLFLSFANGPQYGSGFFADQDADPSDGWLNVVIVDTGRAWHQAWRARRLFLSPRRPARGITRIRVQAAAITGDCLICHVDGETFEQTGTLAVRVQPRALSIAVATEPSGEG